MAGHSKWKTIKHKKAKEDAKRGKEFTKLIKEITVVAREGGGDPSGNPRLRTLLEKAKEINMPADNAHRAIKRGTGELPGVHYEEMTYEGYGPHGIAVMVDALTDNKNRTVADLRRIFSSKGGNLAEGGAVSWMFEKMGVVRAADSSMSEDELLEALLDYDIKDISQDDALVSITCAAKSLDIIKKAIEQLNITVESAELEWVASTTTTLSDTDSSKAIDLLETLEEHDDVKNVYANLG